MPYTLKRGREPAFGIKGISQSTLAMVTVSLWRLLDRYTRPDRITSTPRYSELELPDKENIIKVAHQATTLLIQDIIKNKKYKTCSGTYGPDDPITLAFWQNSLMLTSIGRMNRLISRYSKRLQF
jgi:hypothetical protein